MSGRLFSAKVLPEPMLAYCELPKEQTSENFETNYLNFLQINYFNGVVWKKYLLFRLNIILIRVFILEL